LIHVVDTHALLWYLSGSDRLGAKAKAILEDPSARLVLPAIALAEACWIADRGRTPVAVREVLRAVRSDHRLEVEPLDEALVVRSLTLTAVGEMHDRQIVATTLRRIESGEVCALLSCDGNIVASGLVPIVWD
jgi:PIN domain nuclease of toxin-antitoxin system